MKKKNIMQSSVAAFLLLGLLSCNKLEEYNPSGATPESVWTTPEGFVTAVNSAYAEQRNWYGKEDGIHMSETGTDLWFNRDRNTFARQIVYYDGLSGTDGNPPKQTWPVLWRGVNICNAGINRINDAGFVNATEKNQREGELRFLRAFYYWHLVETYGNVMLRTTETQTPITTATRSTYDELYKLIISDLQFAAQNLPVSWPGQEYARATKKSAMGFLARAYLSRAYYSTGAEAQGFFAKARDAANEVIAKKAELGTDLWTNYADIFAQANNKNNKEALYTVSNSTTFTMNIDDTGNRTHMMFQTNYTNKPGLVRSVLYGFESSRRLMPTRALLDYYSEDIDSRYDASFQEVWLANTPFTWTTAKATEFGKSTVVVGQTLAVGEQAMLVTKKSIPDDVQQTLKYVVYDRDNIYLPDGKVRDGITYPVLKKFNELNRTGPDVQNGTNDIFVMRFAEMYLISAEAEFQLNNKKAAMDMINVLRIRAAKKTPVNQTTAMTLTNPDVITIDFILAERARELAGEFIRWFDVKRIKGSALSNETFDAFIKRTNPDITQVKEFHKLRPIPTPELQSLENAKEFGQNPGYN